MTKEANRLARVGATIKANIGSTRTMLDVADHHLESESINWLGLFMVLSHAQCSLLVSASLAHDEAKELPYLGERFLE